MQASGAAVISVDRGVRINTVPAALSTTLRYDGPLPPVFTLWEAWLGRRRHFPSR